MTRKVRLKDVCREITVGHVGPMVDSYVDSGIPFLRSQNVAPFRIDKSNLKFIDEAFHKKLKKSALRPGDVVVVRTGYPGTASVIPADLPVSNCADLVVIHPSDEIDGYFLCALFNSVWGRGHVAGNLVGVAQQHFNIGAAKEMEISLPPVGVQRKVASILSAYDDLIENNTRRIKILEQMAEMLYREWFVNFRFPGHELVKMVESEMGLIPEGWTVKPLGAVTTITMGLSPRGDTYNEDGNGVPLINGPVEFGERFARAVKWTTAPTKLCRAGDLIVCVRGSTTGRHVKSDASYCLGRGVCALGSKYQCFADLLFQDQLPTLLAKTSGSTFPSWTGPQLKSHPVHCPSIELLDRFETLTRPLSAAVFTFSRQIQNLRTTRDLLLPKLVSGEVSVELIEKEAFA
jgi:type I restriction enzyme S subunit